MRSAPASTAASKTLREPSMLRACVRSLAVRTANARWMTASAPFTASRTLAFSVTSPCRYSVLRRPASLGSKGLRAIPTILRTRRERSSAPRIDIPRSPVGPVTATVMPSAAAPWRGHAGVGDELGVAGAAVGDVVAPARVDHGVAGAAVQPVVTGLAEQHVAAVLAQHLVVARAGVDEVVAHAGHDLVVAGAADHQVAARAGVDGVVAGAGLDVVVSVEAVDRVVAVLAV